MRGISEITEWNRISWMPRKKRRKLFNCVTFRERLPLLRILSLFAEVTLSAHFRSCWSDGVHYSEWYLIWKWRKIGPWRHCSEKPGVQKVCNNFTKYCLGFYQRLFLIMSQQISKTLMASLVPLSHVVQFAFFSLSSTPSESSATLWITQIKICYSFHFTYKWPFLIAIYCIHTHIENLKEGFLYVFFWDSLLGQEPFVYMGKSKENIAKYVAGNHIAGFKISPATLSRVCL